MTKITRRAKAINRLRKVCRERLAFRQMREILSEDEDSLEDAFDHDLAAAFQHACSMRYHSDRGPYRKSTDQMFREDLGWLLQEEEDREEEKEEEKGEEKEDEPPWLNDDEFRQKYRMSKQSFKELYNLLKYYGTEGSGNSNPELRTIFRIGRGTIKAWRDRALKALRNLKDRAYTWPDEDERKEIARRIGEKFDWPNCVGIMDGTLFP